MIRIRTENQIFEFTITFRYWFSKKQYCEHCGQELYILYPEKNTFTCMNTKCDQVRITIVRI
jgi:hypothetical protein